MSIPPVVRVLLILNVVVYILDSLLQVTFGIELKGLFAYFYVGSPYFQIWQPFTYMFMHGGFMHLFFNMFALWMFGRIMEQVWGSKKFLFYYLVCGLGAVMVYTLAQTAGIISTQGCMLGASGAIYGVLLAFGMTFPNERLFIIPIPVPIKAKYLIGAYVLIELFEGISASGDEVAHFAHLGGMLVGLLLILYWRRRARSFHLGGRNFWQANATGGSRQWAGRNGGFSQWFQRKKQEGGYNRNERANYTTTESHATDHAYNQRRREENVEIDRILEKIRQSGYEGLTAAEKKTLFDASKR